MARIIKHRRSWGQVKPPLGAQIDWGHPLARNLQALMMPNSKGTLFNFVNNKRLDQPQEFAVVFDPAKGAKFKDSDTDWIGTQSFNSLDITARSLMCSIRFVSIPSETAFFRNMVGFTDEQDIDPASAVGIGVRSGGSNLNVYEYDGGNIDLTVVANANLQTNFTYRVAYSAQSNKLVIAACNGIITGEAAAGTLFTSLSYVGLNTVRSGAIEYWVDYACFWNRALTKDELREVTINPYAFIQAPSTRQYFFQDIATGAMAMRRFAIANRGRGMVGRVIH